MDGWIMKHLSLSLCMYVCFVYSGLHIADRLSVLHKWQPGVTPKTSIATLCVCMCVQHWTLYCYMFADMVHHSWLCYCCFPSSTMNRQCRYAEHNTWRLYLAECGTHIYAHTHAHTHTQKQQKEVQNAGNKNSSAVRHEMDQELSSIDPILFSFWNLNQSD